MNEPIRTQWQIRCAFNGFCKQALKREAVLLYFLAWRFDLAQSGENCFALRGISVKNFCSTELTEKIIDVVPS